MKKINSKQLKGINKFLVLICITLYMGLFPQTNLKPVMEFNFNTGVIKEENGLTIPKPVGVTLTEDRFGNKDHAVYIHGNSSSYLNLGTSQLLKPKNGTVSIWVKIDYVNYFGKGYDANPIIITRNSDRDDFTFAYAITYDFNTNRISGAAMTDSVNVVNVHGKQNVKLNSWLHCVIAFNDRFFTLYVNGNKIGSLKKKFKTVYNPADSVFIGVTGSKKNVRFFTGAIDDIKIFDKVLSDEEILNLFKEQDPDSNQHIFNEILSYGAIILIFVIIIIILIVRSKKALSKQKAQLDLVNKISELELKVVKSQMNPHFISNCMAAIQELILKGEVERASQYLAKFGFFMRKVLNYSDQNFISLRKELEMIRLYVELEQLRFKKNFEFIEIVSEEVDPDITLVPALITQPFIENAIWHGLLHLTTYSVAKLKISVFYKDNFTIIEIEDNGVGRIHLRKISDESKGTRLVTDKIEALNKLSNTSNYKLMILDIMDDNNINKGTRVIIQLDKVTYE